VSKVQLVSEQMEGGQIFMENCKSEGKIWRDGYCGVNLGQGQFPNRKSK